MPSEQQLLEANCKQSFEVTTGNYQHLLCLPDLLPVDVDVGGLHLAEAVHRLPQHYAGGRQRPTLPLQQPGPGFRPLGLGFRV
jgi:hypothetical protein